MTTVVHKSSLSTSIAKDTTYRTYYWCGNKSCYWSTFWQERCPIGVSAWIGSNERARYYIRTLRVAFTIMIIVVGGLKDNTSSRSVAMSSSIIVGGSCWGRGGCSLFLLMDLSGSPARLSPLNETWWNGDKDDDDSSHDRRRTLDAL